MVRGGCERTGQDGTDRVWLHRLATIVAEVVLLPFALALGLNLFITVERIFGETAGAAAGIVAAGAAIGLWYGFPGVRRLHVGHRERAMTRGQSQDRSNTPLHAKIEQMLTEARVVLPGAQALFGFQLAIVLTQSFEQLPTASMIMHATSLFLVAFAVVLLLAPAAYHRIVYAGEDSEDMHRVGGVLVTAATVPLALGLPGDASGVVSTIMGSPTS